MQKLESFSLDLIFWTFIYVTFYALVPVIIYDFIDFSDLSFAQFIAKVLSSFISVLLILILINKKSRTNSLRFQVFSPVLFVKMLILTMVFYFLFVFVVQGFLFKKYLNRDSTIAFAFDIFINKLTGRDTISFASFFSNRARFSAMSLFIFEPRFISGIFLGPLFEELFHRALVYEDLKGYCNKYFAAIISSLFFSLSHIYLYQIGGFHPVVDSVPICMAAMFFGLVCVYVYEKTQTIWSSILLHALTNFVILTFDTWVIIIFQVICIIVTIFFIVFKFAIFFYNRIRISQDKMMKL